ncbi:MAG: hypothetical protein ABSD28_18230, partial [Tepidisphaeraceae bacterium]
RRPHKTPPPQIMPSAALPQPKNITAKKRSSEVTPSASSARNPKNFTAKARDLGKSSRWLSDTTPGRPVIFKRACRTVNY